MTKLSISVDIYNPGTAHSGKPWVAFGITKIGQTNYCLYGAGSARNSAIDDFKGKINRFIRPVWSGRITLKIHNKY